ncbi:MAG: aldolase catalytic domain-containing protein [Lachnospiraceae bacterium]|nr:aldolase catalytic domain-containing protein [Lachnospiraceae bacterium]
MAEIKLLDCTLRDGGYINDWEFGRDNIINIFERLVSAGMDIIEIGFLDERRSYDSNRTIFPDAASVNRTYQGLDKGNALIVGMIDYGTCSIQHLIPCEDSFMDGLRIIFKKEKMHKAIAFCKEVKKLGYKVFAQAVSITSYNDEELAELIGLVNDLESYAFSLVDTYGLLHKEQLMHYYNFAEAHLLPSIGIGYHAHNNFQLAYANCVELLENPPKERRLLVDGSLYGMGKSAGNAPCELLATYMNERLGKDYDESQLLEAIDVTILDIYREVPWGYNFKFFIAASHDCHPNYVNYLSDKKKLSVRSIHEILNQLEGEKKLLYDKDYIEELYVQYQKRESADKVNTAKLEELGEAFAGKELLLLAPGNTIVSEREKVQHYIHERKPITIAVNFLPEGYEVDYIFISNAKRYVQLSFKISQLQEKIPLIATSNVTKASGTFDYVLPYSELLDEKAMIVDNPMIMLYRLFTQLQAGKVVFAGFDGFTTSQTSEYTNPNMEHSFSKEKAEQINQDVADSIGRIPHQIPMEFLTETQYVIEDIS